MKKQLTIEHLAAYLPYDLIVVAESGTKFRLSVTGNMKGSGIEDRPVSIVLDNKYKPLLRPLSQLTETIEHNGERFVPIEWIDKNTPIKARMCTDSKGKVGLWCENVQASHYNAWPHSLVRILLHMHFDVYNLIDSGLAEPIPSIPQP